MKRVLISVVLAAATISTSVLAAGVGVPVSIGQPGFYGQIDIDSFPQPQVIYRQPRIIERVILEERPPIYMRVPPGHSKNWRKHCHKYNACGERVFFVRDSWYQQEYVPRYREQHHDRRDKDGDSGGKHKNKDRGNGHD